jgi:hypothetical protein
MQWQQRLPFMSDVRSSAVILSRPTQPITAKVVSPWADLPKEMQGGIKSIQNCDYVVREAYDRSAPKLTSTEIKARYMTELRRRKVAEDERAFAAKRAESRMLDTLVEQRIAPVDIVTGFDHRGKFTRSISAPIEEFSAKLEKSSVLELQRRSQVPVSPPRSFTPSAEIADAMGAITFWYPADKQRLRFRLMEEARMAAAKVDLVSHGWTERCPPGGEAKKIGNIDRLHLSPDEERRIQEYLDQCNKDAVAVAAANGDDSSEAGEPSSDAVDAEAAARVPAHPLHVIDDSMMAILTARVEPCNPPQLFKPELPSTALPKKLELPRTSIFKTAAPAPPWGRQTDEEDRWKKRAQSALDELRAQEDRYCTRFGSQVATPLASSNGRSILRPVLKSDVDRELKIVRDGGMLKRPKESVMKSVSSETLAFVKTLPRDFGRKGNTAMQPVPMPGAASLKM